MFSSRLNSNSNSIITFSSECCLSSWNSTLSSQWEITRESTTPAWTHCVVGIIARGPFECSVDINMPSHGQKSKDKSLDSSEDGGSVLEQARTGSLNGESATGRRETSGTLLIPTSDTTCSNEQLLSLQTSIITESGFTTMSGSLTIKSD